MQVDGDTDTPEVQEAFTIALFEAIQHAQDDFVAEHGELGRNLTNLNFEAALLQDLEDDLLATNDQKHQMNGYGPPRDRERAPAHVSTGASVSHGATGQGAVLPQENTFKTHAQVESYPE